MDYFEKLVSQLNGYVGKTISAINVVESLESGDASHLELVFDCGSTLNISPTSYNYGGQDLYIAFND
jgi:hypothetical protein